MMSKHEEEAMPPSPRHWPVELWRKRKREEVKDDEDNKTVIPDDITETPTSPAARPKTESPPPPTEDLEEAADEKPNEFGVQTVTKEELSEEKAEEDDWSDSEIAQTLADLMQGTKDSGKAKHFFMAKQNP